MYKLAIFDMDGTILNTIDDLADSANVICKRYGFPEHTVDEVKYMVRATLNVGMILGEDTNARYDNLYVHGDKGGLRSSVEFNQSGELSYFIYTDDGMIERKITAPQNYSLEVEQLGRCILSGENPHVASDFSVRNAELMDMVFAQIGQA